MEGFSLAAFGNAGISIIAYIVLLVSNALKMLLLNYIPLVDSIRGLVPYVVLVFVTVILSLVVFCWILGFSATWAYVMIGLYFASKTAFGIILSEAAKKSLEDLFKQSPSQK